MSVDARTCVLVKRGDGVPGATRVDYFAGVSAETAGATSLCLHLATFPPGRRARAHLHEHHESAAYVIRGEVDMWFGDGLRDHVVIRTGDFVFIPPRVPHLPANLSETEPAEVVVARSDPSAEESTILLPELDELPHTGRRPRE